MRHIFVEYFNELYHIAVFTRYTANGNNLRFLNPHPGPPRWGRELLESQIIPAQSIYRMIFIWLDAALFGRIMPVMDTRNKNSGSALNR